MPHSGQRPSETIRPLPRTIDSRAVLRFAAASAVAAVAFAATYGVFVLTESGQRLENMGLAGSELRDSADRLDSLGSLSHISVLSFGGAILFILGVALARRRLRLGILIAAVMGGSVVVAELLKEVLPRPELFQAQAWLLRNTFPSGHATVAAALAVGGVLVAPDRFRWVAIPVAAGYASAVGQATQIVGWHRLSGTIGGVLLVLAIAWLALAVLADRSRLDRTTVGRAPPRLVRGLFGVAGAVVFLAVVIAILPVLFPVLLVPDGAGSAFVHTTLYLIGVGATFAAFIAFGVLLEPFSLAPIDDEVRASES